MGTVQASFDGDSTFSKVSTLHGPESALGKTDRYRCESAPSFATREFETCRDPLLSLRTSLGWYGLLSIFAGSIGILAMIGFLSFLWFGHGSTPEGANAYPLWRRLALSNWMTRTITLSSLVLRFIISIQSIVCTSMLAALILEKHIVRKSQVAHLSVMRAFNNGPFGVLQLLLSWRNRMPLFTLEGFLLLLLTLVTFGLQPTSTILLIDIYDFTIEGNSETTTVPSLIQTNPEALDFLPSYQLDQAAIYAVFGEVASNSTADPDTLGFSDTKVKQRGLLPLLGTENRTSVRKYNGNTMIFNSRVVCAPPNIDATYQIDYTPRGSIFGTMVGSVDYGTSLEHAGASSTAPTAPSGSTIVDFNCGIPSGTVSKSLETSFCFVGGIGWTYPSKVSIETQVPLWNMSQPPGAANQSMYLVFSANLDEQEWSTVTTGHAFANGSIDGEWQSFEVMADRFIKISLCFAAYNFERSLVEMSALGMPKEPQLLMDLVTDEAHNTSEVQQYIGVSEPPETAAQRGILHMNVLSPSIPPITDIESTTATLFYLNQILTWQLTKSRTPNQTFLTCWTCAAGGTSIHPSYSTLFQDIIIASNRSANVIQSLISTLAFTIYYDTVPSFTQAEEVNLAITQVVQAPGECHQGCTGYISIMTLLGVHLLCVTLTTLLHRRHIKYSRYGNLWHTISQVASKELKENFDQANQADDKTIMSKLKIQGKDDLVKLGKIRGGHKVEIKKL
ncbi:uncharacterized protein LY89DRAFT_733502 [Mollisia scopiformis]|uniref:Uncharacterized protein n=1 Tax=Mollisia scopiformis TaxID=149040 RepID=A0A194XBW9_MOLSC|nr:uncharacterized protein LY89DRAFT_733502 [Mollisia scopiformis]KUJ17668.1 hypothetical protein LY89DRAFT_733502 [Mollisia scopiformis]